MADFKQGDIIAHRTPYYESPVYEVVQAPVFDRCDSKTGEPIYKMEVKQIE